MSSLFFEFQFFLRNETRAVCHSGEGGAGSGAGLVGKVTELGGRDDLLAGRVVRTEKGDQSLKLEWLTTDNICDP